MDNIWNILTGEKVLAGLIILTFGAVMTLVARVILMWIQKWWNKKHPPKKIVDLEIRVTKVERAVEVLQEGHEHITQAVSSLNELMTGVLLSAEKTRAAVLTVKNDTGQLLGCGKMPAPSVPAPAVTIRKKIGGVT